MATLITYAYFRSETNVSANIDDSTIDNPIDRAQEMVKFILGRAFYDQIITQWNNGTPAWSADNEDLYDPYIKKFLAWQAYEFYLIRANVYESRTGVRTYSEENSGLASEIQMSNLIKDAKQWAQFYKGEILMYIKQEQRITPAKYPLYRDCGEKVGSGFHITAITAKDKTSAKINRDIFLNE
jgi:hypothetical protein